MKLFSLRVSSVAPSVQIITSEKVVFAFLLLIYLISRLAPGSSRWVMGSNRRSSGFLLSHNTYQATPLSFVAGLYRPLAYWR